jgi:hypothetical protein
LKLTASGLIIPTRMNEEPKYVCNIPGCGQRFYDGEEQARVSHALFHATQDEDYIQDAIRSPSEEILGEGDPEYRKYLRDRYEQLKGQVPDPLNPERY